MPRAFELTWDKTLHRWVKVIRGKKYYFSGRVSSKASREDYLKALARDYADVQRQVEAAHPGAAKRRPSRVELVVLGAAREAVP